jgi:hypothetical protein
VVRDGVGVGIAAAEELDESENNAHLQGDVPLVGT